jgi:NAD-dependent deacetylase
VGSDAVIEAVAEALTQAKRGVAFTGAGISTESGIPDFRSPGGIWTRYRMVYYDEFVSCSEARSYYWRMKRDGYADFAAARPNAGHRVLAEWEAAGRIVGVITQNIDGLHRDAGSRNVLELHGTGRFVECVSCGARRGAAPIFEAQADPDDVPQCDACGGWLKPAVVMFGQSMPADVMREAWKLSESADCFLAIGSSLVVEPAASLPRMAKAAGAFLAIINRAPTPLDDLADAVIRRPIGETLAAIAGRIGS